MFIGIPRETLPGERRVAALPETVQKLVESGYRVGVEAGAGQGILLGDDAYRQAGAEIVDDVRELYARADLVLKVKQPHFNDRVGLHEADMLRAGSVLVTFLHPAAPTNHQLVRTLAERGVTSFTMDGVPRTSRAQPMDALTSMSTVTGYRSVLTAAQALGRFVPMIGTAIGVVKPARFLTVGAGVVGLQALATAKRLGAATSCIDIRQEARDAGRSLGAEVAGFEIPEAIALADGGYARSLPLEWLRKEQEVLRALVPQADAVILSALVPGEVAPILIDRSMVAAMKPGAVIVDVAIDQGGNCELTVPGEVAAHKGVTLVGIQNIPGSMPLDASWLYANNLFNYLGNLFKNGGIDWADDIVQATVVTHQGQILHAGARKAMGLS